MVRLSHRSFSLTKRVPLAISRGSSAGSVSYVIEVAQDGVVGLGEAAEYDIPDHEENATHIDKDITIAQAIVCQYSAWQRFDIEQALMHNGVGSSVRAGVDAALFDWAGKMTGQPVWQLLGLASKPRGPISVTIGINTPQGAIERLRRWLELGEIRAVKIKLGATAGIDADKAMFDAVADHVPKGAYIGVDANGGWNIEQAVAMSRWLKERGVVHIEQPIAPNQNLQFRELHSRSALPIFLDESIRNARDVVHHASNIDGINIKLTKCGGISEALRMIHTAHAFGLKTMIGCYGNISLGNAAAFQLSSLVDYIDLDSHLNISNDPTSGLEFRDGYLVHSFKPGLGVEYA